ncbi:MAG: hypothetical protein QOC56_1178, partial [Alphaproteobacteria bacterium]|nr:hypothetical protein [Alphaproteobacteria bacterium]
MTMTNMSNMARDTTKEAKEAVRETTKATSAASGDVQADLAALRDDVTQLTSQIGDILARRGSAAWSKARSNVEGVVSEVQDRG